VDDARVGVRYVMPPMGGMSEMRGDADVDAEGDGQYVATFDLPMAGSWTIEVEVEAGERTGTATFSLTVGTRGLRATGEAAPEPEPDETHEPTLAPIEFPGAALAHLRNAFESYEEVRALLAADRVEGLSPHATRIAEALGAAAAALGDAPPEVADCVREGAARAEALALAGSLDDARARFGELSAFMVALGAADPRLVEGYHLFDCPMAEGYGGWFQRSTELENPYMGPRMLTCGSPEPWRRPSAPATGHDLQPGDDEIAHYTCSMHPSVRQAEEGICPLCGMQLSPVTRGDLRTGIVQVDDETRRRIGVRTGPVVRGPMRLSLRAVGEVSYDQSRINEVTVRVSGFITRLHVEREGQPVRRGQPLFALYSPEIYAAELEYLQARRRTTGTGTSPPAYAAGLAEAAGRRLRLWGITQAQIDALERRGEPSQSVTFFSPASGFVIEKEVVEGAAVEAGMRLYRIAAMDRVWVEADVYESDLPHVRVGQTAAVTLPYVPDRRYEGAVDYIYPYIRGETRTGRVRIELENADLELRADMYANVEIAIDLGERLQVPEPAVIYTGPRRIVFVDLGQGRLQPREIRVGARGGGFYEVLDGLAEGDTVVVSGNFLLAAESRVRSGSELWRSDDDAE
jgi:Cu(I)/Ag(I) efflux system membrane fusion protein